MEQNGKYQVAEISTRAYATAAILAAVGVFCLYFSCPHAHQYGVNLEKQININSALQASIERLPRVGEKLSSQIIEYRQNSRTQSGQAIVFKSLDDLDNIKGIGPKTLERIGPYVKFE